MKNKDLASEIICRQFWIIIILIISLVISNGVWIWYVNQFDFTSETTTLDGSGVNNYIGNNGDINNGDTSSENSENS